MEGRKRGRPRLPKPGEYPEGTIVAYEPDEEKDLVAEDVSSKHIERMARGFIMGTTAIGNRRQVRDILEGKVTDRIGKKGKLLVDKLFELIDGVYIMEKKGGRDGKDIKYYQVPPNLEAIKYALDRVLGKPKQTTEHTEEKKGVMVIEHIIRNLAGEKVAAQVEEPASPTDLPDLTAAELRAMEKAG